jgi:hypothetical protein
MSQENFWKYLKKLSREGHPSGEEFVALSTDEQFREFSSQEDGPPDEASELEPMSIFSEPPVTASKSQPDLNRDEDVFVVDPNIWEAMTEEEQSNYLHDLLRSGKTFILNRVKYIHDPDQGPVSWTYCGPSGPSNSHSE